MPGIQMSASGRLRSVRLWALFLLVCPLYAQNLEAVYGRLDKSAQQFKSLSANIRRDVHTAIVNDDAIENGTIRVKREKTGTRMLIDFTTPDKKTIALDGDTGSVFYPKINTVQVYNVGEKKTLVDQILLLGFGATSEELKTAYDLTFIGAEPVDGKPTGHIQLIPKSKDVLTRIKKAELWISDATGTPLQQRFITSASGDSMLVTYTDVKLNPAIADKDLKLTTPKNVRVEHPQL